MKYVAVKIGAKHTANCVCCGQKIVDVETAVLCQDERRANFYCHPHCCPVAKRKKQRWVLCERTTFVLSK